MSDGTHDLIKVSLLKPVSQVKDIQEESKDRLDHSWQVLFVGMSESNPEKVEEPFHCLQRQLVTMSATLVAYRCISVLDILPEVHDNREQGLRRYLLCACREQLVGDVVLGSLLD